MKNLLLGFVFCNSLISKAQVITAEELLVEFQSGQRNAIKTIIYGSFYKDVAADWGNYLKLYKCQEITDANGEIKGHNVFFKDILNKPIDIYSKFEEDKEAKTIKMSTAIDIGAGNYLKSDVSPAEIKVLEKIVKDFALKMTKAPLEEYLKAAIAHQEKLKNEIKALEKSKIKTLEDVEAAKAKTGKLEKELAEKKAAFEKKKNEVNDQQKIVEAHAGSKSEQAKASGKMYEKLTAQKLSIEQDVLDLQNKILIVQDKKRSLENEIKSNNVAQADKHLEISAQKKMAEDLQQKLNKIH